MPETAAARAQLNPIDIAILAMNRVLRSLGHGGFPIQMHIHLEGRVDAESLRRAVGRLSQAYPVVAGRLFEDRSGDVFWDFQPGGECALEEITLDAGQPDALLRHGERVLAAPSDITQDNPIRFQLLHDSDGHDVLLMQYDHSLMDGNSAAWVLKELSRLADEDADVAGREPQPDEIRMALDRASRSARFRASREAIRVRARYRRAKAITIGTGQVGKRDQRDSRLIVRRLDEAQSSAFVAGVKRAAGFPTLSMALLACAFRAIGRLSTQPQTRRSMLLGSVGVDLGMRGRKGNIFNNQAAMMAFGVKPDELADRDELIRTLNRMMRERIDQRVDLGVLQLGSLMRRQMRRLTGPVRRMMQSQLSLGYGYFGQMAGDGDTLCGVPIESAYQTTVSWSPSGIHLMAGQSHGRLTLAMSHLPECVSEPLAHEFLDATIEDMLAD